VMSGPFEQRGPDEILWIRYCKNGRVYRESAHTTKIRDAEKLLAKRLGEAGNNTLISPSDSRLTRCAATVEDYAGTAVCNAGSVSQQIRASQSRAKGFILKP